MAKAFTQQEADIILQNLKSSARRYAASQGVRKTTVDELAQEAIPPEVREEHYHSDEVHIKALLANAGLEPAGGMELAAATVRGLFLTVSHRDNIGPLYPQVLDALVRGACRQLFP